MDLDGLRLAADDAELPWRPTQVAGVSWLPLHLAGDREGGDSVALIRMEPGCGYPAHRHRGPEDVLILAGGYRDDRGEHCAPAFLRYEAGSVHAPVALGQPGQPAGPQNPACLLFAVARDGVELLAD